MIGDYDQGTYNYIHTSLSHRYICGKMFHHVHHVQLIICHPGSNELKLYIQGREGKRKKEKEKQNIGPF